MAGGVLEDIVDESGDIKWGVVGTPCVIELGNNRDPHSEMKDVPFFSLGFGE